MLAAAVKRRKGRDRQAVPTLSEKFVKRTQMALTSSGMPGPNVVDTAPFWM
jgi:hypothetical protein